MDSITHVIFGGAIAVAVMGRRAPVWKSAMWGAVAQTLPDLDVLLDHGDAIGDMVLHRGATHAPFWQTLASLPLGLAVARLSASGPGFRPTPREGAGKPGAARHFLVNGEWPLWRRWWLTVWLCLVSHALLDAMTVYGTRILLPFTDHPYGLGSIFIIDPLFTLPLLVGVVWALAARGRASGLRANGIGLVLAVAYLAWAAMAQQYVQRIARDSLAAQGIATDRVLVTPAPLNTVLWRVVAVSGNNFHEGFYSLFDAESRIAFDRFERGAALATELQAADGVRRIAAFSKGFYKMQQLPDGRASITDLRMGQEPAYVFAFAVARKDGAEWAPITQPPNVGLRGDVRRGLAWVWRRMWGEALPPPR